MDFTSDKLKSLVRKWQTLIEAHADVKTTDGYLLRIFVIAFTKRRPNQVKKTSYAQSSQIRQIRKRMVDIMNKESSSGTLKDFVQKLIPEVIGREIEKACHSVYPLQNVSSLCLSGADFSQVYVRKVKILKSPKLDLGKLLELHGEDAKETGTSVPRGDFKEPEIQDSV